MPLYDYVCTQNPEHVVVILEPYSEESKELWCQEKVDCGGVLIKQVGATGKTFVKDVDLISARTHYGKDK